VHDDLEGTVLPDDRSAQANAQRVIRELREGGGYADPGLCMIVRNEAGKQLFVIPFGIHRQAEIRQVAIIDGCVR
jgi:hypothetical protein